MNKPIAPAIVRGEISYFTGDETARQAGQLMLDRLLPYFNFVAQDGSEGFHLVDLSSKNRVRTNGRAINDAVAALTHSLVAVKEAGITPEDGDKKVKEIILEFEKELNASTADAGAQMLIDAFGDPENADQQQLAEAWANEFKQKKAAGEAFTFYDNKDPKLTKAAKFNPLATGSPNAPLRKACGGGNMWRSTIPFTSLSPIPPNWKDRTDVEVETLPFGGKMGAADFIAKFDRNPTGRKQYTKVQVCVTDEDGNYLKADGSLLSDDEKYILDTEIDDIIEDLQLKGDARAEAEIRQGIVDQRHKIFKTLFGETRDIKEDTAVFIGTADMESIREKARSVFERAIKERKEVYVGGKYTVIKGYDGVIMDEIEKIFTKGEHSIEIDGKTYTGTYQQIFKERGLNDQFKKDDPLEKGEEMRGLIDAQAASIIAKLPASLDWKKQERGAEAPNGAIWFIPDPATAEKMETMVNALIKYGAPSPEALQNITVSRMCTGGGKAEGHYGSFNKPIPQIKGAEINSPAMPRARLLSDDGDPVAAHRHTANANGGDPIIFMTNERSAIKRWVRQNFEKTNGNGNGELLYFALNDAETSYDWQFKNIIETTAVEFQKENLRKAVKEVINAHNQQQELTSSVLTQQMIGYIVDTYSTDRNKLKSDALEQMLVDDLAKLHPDLCRPHYEIMPSKKVLKKIVKDPPNNKVCIASLNLDGDIYSDIMALLTGSLATTQSSIEGKNSKGDICRMHEAAHGTAPDITVDKFDPIGQLCAFINGIKDVGDRWQARLLKANHNEDIRDPEYALFKNQIDCLERAMFDVVNAGVVTGDLKNRTTYAKNTGDDNREEIVTCDEMLKLIETRMQRLREPTLGGNKRFMPEDVGEDEQMRFGGLINRVEREVSKSQPIELH